MLDSLATGPAPADAALFVFHPPPGVQIVEAEN